jgi:hypothetical protein
MGAICMGRPGAGSGPGAGGGGFGWPVLADSWAGMRSSSGEDAGVNRLAGKAMPSDWCGRPVLYSWRQAPSAACSASIDSNGPCTSSSSRCSVWCRRSILPVMVGERILVSRRVMPFSRQILSNSTSTGTPGLWNRPVNTLPLSVSTSPDTP